jgi:hypothetical protein
MTLPTSGPISLRDIQDEFGGPTPIRLENYYRGGAYVLNTDYAPNVPASGAISLDNFYGAKRTSLTTVTYDTAGNNYLVLPYTFSGQLTVVSMTGGGGGGGGPDSHPGHVGYAGLTITGGTISASPGDVINAYVGAGGGAGGSGGGGGGGGGGKIICQKLAELGYFDKEMNAADQLFGVHLRAKDPDAYAGYVKWARPVVVLLEGGGSETFRKIIFFWEQDSEKRRRMQISIVAYYLDMLARPWAEEMAFRMKAVGYEKTNTAGRFIMNIGLPMCRSIGRWNKTKQWPMWAKTLSIWITVTVLLVAVSTVSTVDKLTNKTRNLFRKKSL